MPKRLGPKVKQLGVPKVKKTAQTAGGRARSGAAGTVRDVRLPPWILVVVMPAGLPALVNGVGAFGT